MKKWSNAEKLKVVQKAGELIVDEGWDEEKPLNALYWAHLYCLPAEKHSSRADLLENSGKPDTILKSVANKVAKLKKAE